eukprot:15014-Heterococcus_DN1.PRE.2
MPRPAPWRGCNALDRGLIVLSASHNDGVSHNRTPVLTALTARAQLLLLCTHACKFRNMPRDVYYRGVRIRSTQECSAEALNR